jgi:hypothetical protein
MNEVTETKETKYGWTQFVTGLQSFLASSSARQQWYMPMPKKRKLEFCSIPILLLIA